MKINPLLIVLLLFFNFSNSQTTIGFKSANQTLEMTNDLEELEVTLDISYPKFYNSKEPITLEIFSDLEDKMILQGITKTEGKDIIITSSDLAAEKKISLFLNTKKLKDKNYITLSLKKKGVNTNFELKENTHTIILTKKEKQPSSLISIIAYENSDLRVDFLNDDELIIPVKIKSTGYVPVEHDTVTVKLKIKDIEDYNKNIEAIKIVGAENIYNIRVSKEKFPNEFEAFIKKIKDKETLEVEIDKVESKSKNSIKADDKNKVLKFNVRATNKNKNKYSFYIGTNFDLKDKFEATSFYSEIDLWMPELIDDTFGVRAGIFKNNNSRTLDESRRLEVLTNIVSTTSDSITFVTKRVENVPNVSIENLGLYFEFLIKMVEDNNFSAHLALHFELIQRKESYTFTSRDLFNLGESTISIDSLANNQPLQLQLSQPNSYIKRYVDTYYGVGLPMSYVNNDKSFEAFFNPILGIGAPGLNVINPKSNETQIKAFGLFQFSLIERKFGIKLSGEVRKYINYFQEPIISVNLSKKIDLSKILDSSEN